jgi:hypothetical protein
MIKIFLFFSQFAKIYNREFIKTRLQQPWATAAAVDTAVAGQPPCTMAAGTTTPGTKGGKPSQPPLAVDRPTTVGYCGKASTPYKSRNLAPYERVRKEKEVRWKGGATKLA